ncbi:hypothetical protein FDA38_07985 [Kribbella jiaozuonensis]|uniref:Uncharacterized protein n=1 Tax=Kribbella jiaozuonensis TaxID=2575441 RepID=A0A4U3M3Y8_9ACTN|nr:hypothetical protein FDA38_07985 [Kribbella jiaozuonensis]
MLTCHSCRRLLHTSTDQRRGPNSSLR